jgi:hypothetical protein
MFIEDLPWMLPNKLWFIRQSGFRGEDSNVKSEQTDDGHQVMAKPHKDFRPDELQKLKIWAPFRQKKIMVI